MSTEKPAPWEASGYSIWLLSSHLQNKIAPTAKRLCTAFPYTYGVKDGHVTLYGNIPSMVNEQSIINLAAVLNEDLRQEPLRLSFVNIYSNPQKPSQTLCLEAKFSPRFSGMRQRIAKELELILPDITPKIHASILYNLSGYIPLAENMMDKIIPVV